MPDARLPGDHRGTRAIQRLVEFAPSTGGLALWVKHQDRPPDLEEPAVATDGNTLFYGPKFEALPVIEQAGLVAHEVLHIALRHPQRYLELKALLGDVDLKLFNVCADAIVNSSLLALELAQAAARLRVPRQAAFRSAWQDGRGAKSAARMGRGAALSRHRRPGAIAAKGPQGRSPLAEWRRRKERQRKRQKRANLGFAGERDPKDGFKSSRARAMGANIIMDIAPAPDPNAPPESEAHEALLWSERVQRSHASDGMHSMLRSLLADLPKVRTPWEQVLRTQLARSLSKKVDISWSRPSRSYIANQGWCGGRRMPFEPGFSLAKPTPRLVVIVDVSGFGRQRPVGAVRGPDRGDHAPAGGGPHPRDRRRPRSQGGALRAGRLGLAKDRVPGGAATQTSRRFSRRRTSTGRISRWF